MLKVHKKQPAFFQSQVQEDRAKVYESVRVNTVNNLD